MPNKSQNQVEEVKTWSRIGIFLKFNTMNYLVFGWRTYHGDSINKQWFKPGATNSPPTEFEASITT